jgi:NitT/TauT family transport system substrate-binding protein
MVGLAATLIGVVACGDDDGAVTDDDASEANTASTGDPGTTADGAAPTTAAASDGELTDVHLTLEWVVQTEFAGYYVARAKGFYQEEGIDLTIQPGGPDVNPVQLLVAGDTDIAVNAFGNALVARESGADVISIGQVFERSAFRLVSFADAGIDTAEDFAGKTVGLWGGFNPALYATAGKYDLVPDEDFTVFNQGFDMEALFSGEVDLASAMTYNEYAQALVGAGEREIAVFDFNEEGTATLENALIVTRDWAEENPDLAEGFIRATMKGWLYCRDNPEECTDVVLDEGPALPENYQLWQMNEVNKLVWPSTNGLLLLTPEMFEQTAEILQTYGVISEPATEESYDMTYRDAAAASLEGEDLFGADFAPLDLDPAVLFAEEG